MGQGKRIVQVAIYLVFLLSIFGSALGDQNNTDEAAPIADADDSNSTDLNSTIYETEEEDDDNSTTTTPQPGALTSQYKYVVKTKLAFPYASLAAFDAQEAKIISAMKRSTGASAVEVLSRTLVTTRRSPSARALLATTVQAEFAVGVDTPEAAAKAVSGLSAENLNAALQNAGVEAATVIEAPKVTTQDGEAVDLSTTSIRQAPGDIVSNPAKGQAYVFADGTKTLATLVAEGTVTSFSVKWTKTSDGSAITYPSDGATTKMKSSEGFHIAGRAVDIELVLPAGADYGVIATLPISFNNNGDLPTARRAAATGYEFRINADCNCTATTDGDSAKCSILKNGISTAQPLLVPTSKCSSNALALGLGLGLGLGLPLLLAILVYSYWFYSRRAKPQDRADARSQGGTSQV